TTGPPGHEKPPVGTDRGRVEPGRWRAGNTLARVRAWLGTTPARVWLLTMTVVVTVAGLFASASITLGHARDGSNLLGHEAGPRRWPRPSCTWHWRTWTPVWPMPCSWVMTMISGPGARTCW